MKERYIRLMERCLAAYSQERILDFFGRVKEKGRLWEHGFPRLTANIGILMAHGYRRDLLGLFLEMMEFCCKDIPNGQAANDFSVRELICCMEALSGTDLVSREDLARWEGYLATIDPKVCYDVYANTPEDPVKNWALFTGVSEFFRRTHGLCDSMDFIETQVASQLKSLDENGMYMDEAGEIHHPMVYDLVSRGLFVLLLHRGYEGPCRAHIDDCLRRAGLLSLQMQSTTGDIPCGGRSNQFLHNEPWLATTFEYEARRYAREGDMATAARFKAAADRAITLTESWLYREPIRHIKNRFPTETGFGCEFYAYFDKYMITAASFLYTAWLVCDDTIPWEPEADLTTAAQETSRHFHKLFLKSGGYALEFDRNADPHYDAMGLCRVHRAGAPAAICLSCACPSEPSYTVDIPEPRALSLCSAVREGDRWLPGAEAGYEVLEKAAGKDFAEAVLLCRFQNGETVRESYRVNGDGVAVTAAGRGAVGYMLPAFQFDGETETVIAAEESRLTVTYGLWRCCYTTDGRILDLDRIGANRNGRYRAFLATGEGTVRVEIRIEKI